MSRRKILARIDGHDLEGRQPFHNLPQKLVGLLRQLDLTMKQDLHAGIRLRDRHLDRHLVDLDRHRASPSRRAYHSTSLVLPGAASAEKTRARVLGPAFDGLD